MPRGPGEEDDEDTNPEDAGTGPDHSGDDSESDADDVPWENYPAGD